LAEAERILGKVIRADTVSQPNHLAGALLALGGLAHIRGDLDLERRCLIKASDLQTADIGARVGIEANLAMLEPDRSQAARRMSEASEHARTLDDPLMAVLCDLAVASLLIGSGSQADIDASVQRAELGLRQAESVTFARHLRALLHGTKAQWEFRFGSTEVGFRLLEDFRRGMLDLGQKRQAARAALQLGRHELRRGRPYQAVRHLVPAALGLNALRFVLESADQRAKWTEISAAGMADALGAARELGDRQLIAELIVTAQGNGMPLAVSPAPDQSLIADAIADSLVVAVADREGVSQWPSARPEEHVFSTYGVESQTRLPVPPLITMPGRRLALVEFLEDIRLYSEVAWPDKTVTLEFWC
jgi:hypothetical protein